MSFLKTITVVISISLLITAIILLAPYIVLKLKSPSAVDITEVVKDEKVVIAYVKALNDDVLEISFRYNQNKSEEANKKFVLKSLINYFFEGRIILAIKSGTEEIVFINMKNLQVLNLMKVEIKTIKQESSIAY